MSTDRKFAPRTLTASEYVRELFGPEDNAAILVRSRSTGHTVQTIARAEAVASPDFQSWLAAQSAGGYDVRSSERLSRPGFTSLQLRISKSITEGVKWLKSAQIA